jgi:hypothetical protein
MPRVTRGRDDNPMPVVASEGEYTGRNRTGFQLPLQSAIPFVLRSKKGDKKISVNIRPRCTID